MKMNVMLTPLVDDQYANNDFGDTHSLTLIVDSLNVQNTLLQLVSAGQGADAAKTFDTILSVKSRRWRHGDSVTHSTNDNTWRQAA